MRYAEGFAYRRPWIVRPYDLDMQPWHTETKETIVVIIPCIHDPVRRIHNARQLERAGVSIIKRGTAP